ncbi:hypothetical protein D5018_03990 [Parashewanella curva]|uniref:Uncharacterized protein n=1 Tax=Parashewanella curva TaxID=2338552 RepID=A0A3L8Q0N9_9GAMM|nr:hypothetical protein [Parashewanella curva]RLV61010.1 hypothetical protein D5018_03990 [Parashewanella curva]
MTVQLTFTTPLADYTYPLQLRFGGSVPQPEPPIKDGSIGIEVGTLWTSTTAIEEQTTVQSGSDAIGQQVEFNWNSAKSIKQQVASAWHKGELLNNSIDSIWSLIALTHNQIKVVWIRGNIEYSQTKVDWVKGQVLEKTLQSDWVVNSEYLEHTDQVNWILGNKLNQIIVSRYNSFEYRTNDHDINWGPHASRWICSTKYRPPVDGKVKLEFKEPFATSPSPIQLRFTPSPNYCYFDDGGGLIDSNPVLPPIDFKLPIEPQIRRSYLMQPTLECVRVSDNKVIVLSGVSLSHARGQYAWSIRADFSSQLDAKNAENQLLKLTINGYEFFAFCEQCSVSRSFNQTRHSATGRSRVAELALPHQRPISYNNTVDRSFAGAVSDILQNSGWSADVSAINDFTIPAGALSLSQVSPIEAVNQMAGQLGCMLECDDEKRTIKVLPKFPTTPWNFNDATVDVSLHESVITNHSETEQINKLCNACWVRGEQFGVSAKVKRTGSAGDVPAADINQPLIVHNSAAQLAGTHAIAETGRKRNHSITVPIMNDLPPLKSGMLLGVALDGRTFKATINSVNIDVRIGDNAAITVSQTVNAIEPLE